ncbi:MAG TPA: hypothetical protein VMS17_06090 [Gemmataceae bacterium]|nr:hypothetical protein [Gemmataceae bacterium]
MKRFPWMTTAVLLLAASAPAAWAAPNDKSLSWVPATAPVVAHLNGLDALRSHVAAFLKNAVPGQGDALLAQYDSMMQNGVQGRKLRGLSKDGPIFFVVTDLPPNPDSFGLVAAVSDYAAFRDNILSDEEKKAIQTTDGYESTTFFGTPIYLVNKKTYVVFTPSKELAASYVKKGTGAEGAGGLETKLSKVQAAKFLASDAGYYVDMEAINKQFADQIKDFRNKFHDQLDQAAQAVGPEQKAQFEMAKKMFDPLFQAAEDAKAALATVEVHPDGVTLHMDVEPRSGTATADLFKGFTPQPFKDLGKLPAGNLAYGGVAFDPAMLKLVGDLMNGLANDPKFKDAAAAFEDWSKSGPTGQISAFSYPASGLSITQCAEPDKAVAAAVKALQSFGSGGAFSIAFKDKPEVKQDAEKYNSISFTSIHMVWDFDKMMAAQANGPQLPDAMKKQLIESLKKLIGEEMNAYIGVDGKTVVQVSAKDWTSAQKLLDGYYKGQDAVGADKGFSGARKQLPDQATVLVVLDAVQAAGDVMDFMKPIMQTLGVNLPPNYPAAVKGKPGYVGFAVTMRPESGGVDFVVTAEAVRQIYQGYVAPLMPAH